MRGYFPKRGDFRGYLDFAENPKTQDAVAMHLQQILECTSKLSQEARGKLKINWSALVAMRNEISNSYVDVAIVWEVIKDFEEFHKLIGWARKIS
ncbi:MAG TPA: HepT-like ribonuclease domain-containing protein [Pseudobdellovibrionaceae bacterium]